MLNHRSATALVITLLLAFTPGPALTAQGRDDVQATMEGFLVAFNNLDMPAFIAYFADDATFFNRPAPPPQTFPDRVQGKREIQRVFQVVFDQIRAGSGRSAPPFQNIEPQDLLVQRFDDVAIVTFHLGTMAARSRRSFVLRRIGEAWKIEHLHASTFETAVQPAQAAPSDVSSLAWLAGCWQSDGAEPGSGESWMSPAGGTMFGMSRTVRGGKTVAFEFMELRALADGRLAFVAHPSGQEGATFPLVRLENGEAVFENTGHDFPQRVVYGRDGASKLKARIEGTRNTKPLVIPFPMTRVSCEPQRPGANQ